MCYRGAERVTLMRWPPYFLYGNPFNKNIAHYKAKIMPDNRKAILAIFEGATENPAAIYSYRGAAREALTMSLNITKY